MTASLPQLRLYFVLAELVLTGVLVGCGHERGIRAACPRASDDSVLLAGRYVQISIPINQKNLGSELLELGDRAIPLFAKILALPPPVMPLRATLLDHGNLSNAESRTRIEEQPSLSFPGFSTRTGGACLRIIPESDRASFGAPGDLEALFLHELAHLFQQSTLPRYTDQPPWLKEGVADFLAFMALSDGDRADVTRLLYFSDRLRAVQDAIASRQYVPLQALIRRDAIHTTLEYAESFSILYLLQKTDELLRHNTLEGFLHDISRIHAPFIREKTNRDFFQRFGSSAILDTEWITRMRNEKVSEWARLGLEVRISAKGGLLLQSYGATWGILLNSARSVHVGMRIYVDAEMQLGWTRQFDVVIGMCDEKLLGIEFARSGATRLWMWSPAGGRDRRSIFLSKRRSSLGDTRIKHHVVVDLTSQGQVLASVDSQPALETALPCMPEGLWGLGTFDGSILFQGLTLVKLPEM